MSLQDRIRIVRDATAFKKTDRIPTVSNYWSWMILDSPYKLSEAICDYDKMYEVVTGFHERYDFDFYNFIGARNPVRVSEAAGSNIYLIDDEKESIVVKDHHYMEEDEYDALIENPFVYQWTYVVNRAATKFHGPGNAENFRNAVAELQAYQAGTGKIAKDLVGKYGVPIAAANRMQSAPELLFSYYRGIRGLSIDLRRRYDKVKAACEAINASMHYENLIEKIKGPKPEDSVFNLETGLLAHSIFNRKQFEDIYWPVVKKMIDAAAEAGNSVNMFCEAEFLRFADLIADYPRGTILFEPEQDDIFALRRAVPNVAIGGGMPPALLYGGTPQQCVDYAKRLVEEVGADGGFVMGQTKMMSFRIDAKRENVLAVQEFCRNCRG